MTKYRILTTWKFTNYFPEKVDIVYYDLNRINSLSYYIYLFKLLKNLRDYDGFLIANPVWDLLLLCFISKYILRNKTSIIVFDILLKKPGRSIKSRLFSYIIRISCMSIDKFFCNHLDTSGYEKYYKIPHNKFYYIPFKANNYDIVGQFNIKDEGYILANGASLRDFDTFIKAINKTGYPAKIVLPGSDIAGFHNTYFKEDKCPPNVMIIRHDFDRFTWNEYMANSRIVVIPIRKDTIQSAGISVLMEAMALGKPVIVTEGVATKGILPQDAAITVPPGDYLALYKEIMKLWNNEGYRQKLSENAKKFALSFGGADRMVKDIINGLIFFLENKSQ